MRTNLEGALVVDDIAPSVINQGVAMTDNGIVCYTTLTALGNVPATSVVHGIGAVITDSFESLSL
jgi:hypothetical protein